MDMLCLCWGGDRCRERKGIYSGTAGGTCKDSLEILNITLTMSFGQKLMERDFGSWSLKTDRL